jgi:hypothetical protein
MVRTFLVRGMLVGIVAGLLSVGFLKVYGEPQVDRAVAFETQRDEASAAAKKAEGHMHMSDQDEHQLVSRSVQAGFGLFVAVLVYSTAFGGLFGLAYAFAYGRISGTLTPQALSAALAATGFVAIYLVPNLKYPANPPSVGEPENRHSHRALFLDDRDFSRCNDCVVRNQALVCRTFWRMECQPFCGRLLHTVGGNSRLAPPRCQ